jgi:hypothetical protein
MPFALPIALLALAAAVALAWRRRERAWRHELEALEERVSDLARRLEAAEQGAAEAQAQAVLSEGLLVEKGITDRDEIEELRRRLVGGDPSRDGDDAIH